MSLRGPISSLAPNLGRASSSTCFRNLHVEASPATRLRPTQILPRRSTTVQPLPWALVRPRRQFTSVRIWCEKVQEPTRTSSSTKDNPSEPSQSKIYTYEDIVAMTEDPDPYRILIDVREPAELASTGKIPTSLNIPLQTSPDFAFLPASEFEARFGFPRPTSEQEVVFYCKAGVRSRAAARLAVQAGFGKVDSGVGEFPGSWGEWSAKGGKVERG